MSLRSARAGFSLVEVVIAAGLLFLTCVAVGALLSGSLKAERSLDRRSRVEAVLDAECERLSSLAFFRPAAPPAAGGRPLPTSLLAEVFPHACSELNTAAAQYRGGGTSPEGPAFVTTACEDGVQLRRVAQFLVVAGGTCEPVAVADLRDWLVWVGPVPPSAALALTIEADSPSTSACRSLELVALRPLVEPSATPPAALGT